MGEVLTRLTILPLCVMSICNHKSYPIFVLRADIFGYDCTSSCPSLSFLAFSSMIGYLRWVYGCVTE